MPLILGSMKITFEIESCKEVFQFSLEFWVYDFREEMGEGSSIWVIFWHIKPPSNCIRPQISILSQDKTYKYLSQKKGDRPKILFLSPNAEHKEENMKSKHMKMNWRIKLKWHLSNFLAHSTPPSAWWNLKFHVCPSIKRHVKTFVDTWTYSHIIISLLQFGCKKHLDMSSN